VSSNSAIVSERICATGLTESMRPATWPLNAIDASISPPKYRSSAWPNSRMMFCGGSRSKAVVLVVRSARRAGPGPNRFRNTVSVSFALMIEAFQLA